MIARSVRRSSRRSTATPGCWWIASTSSWPTARFSWGGWWRTSRRRWRCRWPPRTLPASRRSTTTSASCPAAWAASDPGRRLARTQEGAAHGPPPPRCAAASGFAGRDRLGLGDLLQGATQVGQSALAVVELLQAEQAYAEGLELLPLVAHQRYAAGHLQAGLGEPADQAGIVGVADHHAGGREAGGRHAPEAELGQQLADAVAQGLLLVTHPLQAVGLDLVHDVAQLDQAVGGQGGVVGVPAPLVGLHDLQPLLEVAGEARAGGVVDGLAGLAGEHHHGAAGGGAPALLGGADQDVDAEVLHIDPDGAGGDAVEHKQAALLMDGIGHLADVVIGKDDAGGGLHVGHEDDVRLLVADRLDHLLDGRRGEGRGGILLVQAAGLEDVDIGRDAAHLEDLAPAIAEPAVADHQAAALLGELTSYRLHAEGAAAGHDHRAVGVIDPLEVAGDIAHHLLEAGGHVVQGAVGVDHRIFQQPIGVNVGKQAWHVNLRDQAGGLRAGEGPWPEDMPIRQPGPAASGFARGGQSQSPWAAWMAVSAMV